MPDERDQTDRHTKADGSVHKPGRQAETPNGTVRLSEDDGETFARARQIKAGAFVYSAAAQMQNGEIGVLFEPDTACREIKFVSFSTEWIKGNDN